MVQHLRKIKLEVKRTLRAEAGNKCANPGCANRRVHFHHIKHWAVYRAHATADMIAVCPTCHDACHHGIIKIDDATLHAWKGITRTSSERTAILSVEPAERVRLLVGRTYLATVDQQELSIFRLDSGDQLSFRILDHDLLRLQARLCGRDGTELFRVVDNTVRVENRLVTFDTRPGRARIAVPISEEFIPQWVVAQVRQSHPQYGASGVLEAIDLEVIRPGEIRVMGFWRSGEKYLVALEDCIVFCDQRRPRAAVIFGGGGGIYFSGSVSQAFHF